MWCNPARIYLENVNNGNARTIGEICSNLTLKTPKRRQWLTANFEQISHCFSVSIIDFEQMRCKLQVENALFDKKTYEPLCNSSCEKKQINPTVPFVLLDYSFEQHSCVGFFEIGFSLSQSKRKCSSWSDLKYDKENTTEPKYFISFSPPYRKLVNWFT